VLKKNMLLVFPLTFCLFFSKTSRSRVAPYFASEFEPGSIRQISRRISRTERSARRENWLLDFRIETGQSPVVLNKKVSRDFDVIQPVSGPLPDCFLSNLQNFFTRSLPRLSHSKTYPSEGKVTELRRALKAQSARFSVLCSAN
jgi:hypothetical protein